MQIDSARQHGGHSRRAQLGDATQPEPAEAVHLGQTAARTALDESALAAQALRVDALRQSREQVQILLRGIGEAAEVEQGFGSEGKAGLFRGLAHRRLARRLAVVDAALGQIPVALAGHMAEQQLARRRENDDAATQAPASGEKRFGHAAIVPLRASRGAITGLRRSTGREILTLGATRFAGPQRRSAQLTMLVMTGSPAFTIFATAIGDCAIAWNAAGLVGVWLPEASPTRLRLRVARRHPDATEAQPQGDSAVAIAAIAALLRGERTELRAIRIDDTKLDAFDRRVYAAARTIPPGRVVTYAALAERVGGEASARAVGRSLGCNPFPLVVPCHRIVAASGELGGFSAPGGAATKRRLLTIEDARLDGPGDLFDPTGSAVRSSP